MILKLFSGSKKSAFCYVAKRCKVFPADFFRSLSFLSLSLIRKFNFTKGILVEYILLMFVCVIFARDNEKGRGGAVPPAKS